MQNTSTDRIAVTDAGNQLRKMGASSQNLFGGARGQRADPGTYGVLPRGYRLPPSIQLGEVRLRVANLGRSLDYYMNVLGMRVVERSETRALLGTHGDNRVLVELNETPGIAGVPKRSRLGLFHFAILLPDRPSLGRFVKHLAEIDVQPGAGDHLVSEAFYLNDPDGLGIEVYADRPRDSWRRNDKELMMASDPVDIADLVRAAGDVAWTGMPAGTVMGHVHLHVGSIDEGAAFYSEALGFDRVAWSYPGALFMSAGGYHHHLGTNIWAGAGAQPAGKEEAGLNEWIIEFPDVTSIDAAAASITSAGYTITRAGSDAVTSDPWGTGVRLRAVAR